MYKYNKPESSTLTFRVADARKDELDLIAESMDRDRTYVINEALSNYIELHKWQVEHIKKGLQQAKQGKFASDADVSRVFK